MNNLDVKQSMDRLVAGQPHPRHAVEATLRRGRQRVLARRAVATVGAGALAVAAFAMVPAFWSSGETDVQGQVTDTAEPLTDAEVLQQCTDVDNRALDSAVFGPGSTVKTSESIPGYTGAVIISSDSSTWGACQLYADPTSEQLSERVGPPGGYSMKPPEPSPWGLETNGWEVDNSLRYIDRFPADVARVQLAFPNGLVLSADAVDGFVVMQRDHQGIGDQDTPAITLYGADGQVLADESMAPADASLPPEYRTLVPGPEDALGPDAG